jgi:hypothetical protein
MKFGLALLAIVSSATLATTLPARADTNSLSLMSEPELANVATLDVNGDYNRLQISQDFNGSGPGNSLSLRIDGDLNGGPLGTSFSAPLAAVGLSPGQISQSGSGNAMSIRVSGSGNLFAALQSGSSNMLTAAMIGHNNQASVAQYGSGNILSFTQNGTGNILSVVQRAW